MAKQIEVKLVKADLVEWITAGDEVSAEEVEQYVKKYVDAMQAEMGEEYEVYATDNVIQDSIGSFPMRYADEEDLNAYDAAIEEVTSNWTW